MIRAVIFDADGVIVSPLRFWANQLEKAHAIDPAPFVEFIFHGDFQKCLIGQADLKEVLPPVLGRLNWTRG